VVILEVMEILVEILVVKEGEGEGENVVVVMLEHNDTV